MVGLLFELPDHAFPLLQSQLVMKRDFLNDVRRAALRRQLLTGLLFNKTQLTFELRDSFLQAAGLRFVGLAHLSDEQLIALVDRRQLSLFLLLKSRLALVKVLEELQLLSVLLSQMVVRQAGQLREQVLVFEPERICFFRLRI